MGGVAHTPTPAYLSRGCGLFAQESPAAAIREPTVNAEGELLNFRGELQARVLISSSRSVR